MIHLSGRSANVHDRECSYELSPLTRWTIGGAAADNDVPPAPIFGLNSPGQGLCEVAGIGFHDLTNTRSISAGSLTLHFWNELRSGNYHCACGSCSSEETTVLRLFRATVVQYRSVCKSVRSWSASTRFPTINWNLSYNAALWAQKRSSHDGTSNVWPLERKAFVIPFVKGVFGTAASGSYSQVLTVPDIRIAAAELYVTNVKGNSQVGVASFSTLVDGGIRPCRVVSSQCRWMAHLPCNRTPCHS